MYLYYLLLLSNNNATILVLERIWVPEEYVKVKFFTKNYEYLWLSLIRHYPSLCYWKFLWKFLSASAHMTRANINIIHSDQIKKNEYMKAWWKKGASIMIMYTVLEKEVCVLTNSDDIENYIKVYLCTDFLIEVRDLCSTKVLYQSFHTYLLLPHRSLTFILWEINYYSKRRYALPHSLILRIS